MTEIRLQFIVSNCYRYTLWVFYRFCVSIGLHFLVPRCIEPWYVSAVASDGDVLCHCTASLKPFVLGTLGNESMDDIWNGEPYNALRVAIFKGKLPHYRCIGCAHVSFNRFKQELVNLPKLPVLRKLYIEPTALCNLSCISCQNRNILQRRRQKYFDTDTLKALIRSIGQTIETIYPFFDGEIFLNPESYSILEIIRHKLPGVFILLHTNGILLDTIEKRRRVIDTVDQVIFSVDGATQKTYGKYRVGGNFEKALNNMKLLIKERDDCDSKSPRVDWKYLIFRWNSSSKEIRLAKGLATDIGVDRIMFQPTIRPFWGASLWYLLFNKGITSWKIGRMYSDRSFVNNKEMRLKHT